MHLLMVIRFPPPSLKSICDFAGQAIVNYKDLNLADLVVENRSARTRLGAQPMHYSF